MPKRRHALFLSTGDGAVFNLIQTDQATITLTSNTPTFNRIIPLGQADGATITLTSFGTFTITGAQKQIAGAATISLTATGTVILRKFITGASTISLTSTGSVVKRKRITQAATPAISLTSAGQVNLKILLVQAQQATITLTSTGIALVNLQLAQVAGATIRLTSNTPSFTKRKYIAGAATITLTSTGTVLMGNVVWVTAWESGQSYPYNPLWFHPSTQHKFRSLAKLTSGPQVKTRLFDVTAGSAVAGSELTFTSPSLTWLETSALSLFQGEHQYRAEVGKATGSTGVAKAHLITAQGS